MFLGYNLFMSIKTKWIISVILTLSGLYWFRSESSYIASRQDHTSVFVPIIIFYIGAIYSKTKIIFSNGSRKSQDDIALETLNKIAKSKAKK